VLFYAFAPGLLHTQVGKRAPDSCTLHDRSAGVPSDHGGSRQQWAGGWRWDREAWCLDSASWQASSTMISRRQRRVTLWTATLPRILGTADTIAPVGLRRAASLVYPRTAVQNVWEGLISSSPREPSRPAGIPDRSEEYDARVRMRYPVAHSTTASRNCAVKEGSSSPLDGAPRSIKIGSRRERRECVRSNGAKGSGETRACHLVSRG
jgi:hypothetical protein